ncbi:MAG: hypothetical protein K6L81_02510 [Agarilytica sp.]
MNLHAIKSTEVNEIDRLASLLERAKQHHKQAGNFVIEIENEITEICGVEKEGSTTFKGDQYKITTTGKVNRKLIVEDLDRDYQQLPPHIKVCIKHKPELIKKNMDNLREADSAAYLTLCKYFTEKPAKNAVSISRVGG